MTERPEISFDAITTYEDLQDAYDLLINYLRSLLTPDYLGGWAPDEVLTYHGRPHLSQKERDGPDDLVMTLPDRKRPGRFYLVFNERGKPGGATGKSVGAERALRSCTRPAISAMAYRFGGVEWHRRRDRPPPPVFTLEIRVEMGGESWEIQKEEMARLTQLLWPE